MHEDSKNRTPFFVPHYSLSEKTGKKSNLKPAEERGQTPFPAARTHPPKILRRESSCCKRGRIGGKKLVAIHGVAKFSYYTVAMLTPAYLVGSGNRLTRQCVGLAEWSAYQAHVRLFINRRRKSISAGCILAMQHSSPLRRKKGDTPIWTNVQMLMTSHETYNTFEREKNFVHQEEKNKTTVDLALLKFVPKEFV